METIHLDVDKSKRYGMMKGSYVEQIREAFSVTNDAAKFARYRNRFTPSRKYIITPAGRFDVGMYLEIKKYITKNNRAVVQDLRRRCSVGLANILASVFSFFVFLFLHFVCPAEHVRTM